MSVSGENGEQPKATRVSQSSQQAGDMHKSPEEIQFQPWLIMDISDCSCVFQKFCPPVMEKCIACLKTVYPLERLVALKHVYHKSCFRCVHCGTNLRLESHCCKFPEFSFNSGFPTCLLMSPVNMI